MKNEKLKNKLKQLNKLIQKLIKFYQCMKEVIKRCLLGMFACLCLTACGMTKATVSKPAAGTTTTITITTNNPVTTDVSPDVDLNYKGKEANK